MFVPRQVLLLFAFAISIDNWTEGLLMSDAAIIEDNENIRHHGDNNWQKSSYSMSNGHCVEVRRLADGRIGVRDSKAIGGPVLRFEPTAWAAFLKGLRDSASSSLGI